jgi:hypothetical protein
MGMNMPQQQAGMGGKGGAGARAPLQFKPLPEGYDPNIHKPSIGVMNQLAPGVQPRPVDPMFGGDPRMPAQQPMPQSNFAFQAPPMRMINQGYMAPMQMGLGGMYPGFGGFGGFNQPQMGFGGFNQPQMGFGGFNQPQMNTGKGGGGFNQPQMNTGKGGGGFNQPQMGFGKGGGGFSQPVPMPMQPRPSPFGSGLGAIMGRGFF